MMNLLERGSFLPLVKEYLLRLSVLTSSRWWLQVSIVDLLLKHLLLLFLHQAQIWTRKCLPKKIIFDKNPSKVQDEDVEGDIRIFSSVENDIPHSKEGDTTKSTQKYSGKFKKTSKGAKGVVVPPYFDIEDLDVIIQGVDSILAEQASPSVASSKLKQIKELFSKEN